MNNSQFRFLHISDIHAEPDSKTRIERVLNSIAERLSRDSTKLDCVVVSGDLAYRGRRQEYDILEALFRGFADLVNVPPKRFLIVPGNHDVDRSKIDPYREAGIQSLLRGLDQADKLWADDEQRKLALSAQAEFWAFADRFGAQADHEIMRLSGGRTIGFALLNSAWRASSDGDRGRLFVSSEQSEKALKNLADCDLRVAVLHHPTDWLHDSEAPRLRALFSTSFHVICSGHTHVIDSNRVVSPIGDTYYSTAKAICDPSIVVGATVISVDLDTRQLRAEHWRYSDRTGQLNRDTELAENGEHSVTLSEPKLTAISRSVARSALVNHTENSGRELARRVSLLAPQLSKVGGPDLLEPTINLRTDSKPTRISVSELVALVSSKNALIHGPPFVGRSTLLLQLMRQVVANRRDALRLSFSVLPQHWAPSICNNFGAVAGLSNSMSADLFRKGVTLFIDDVDLGDTARCEVLRRLPVEYPTLKIVGAVHRSGGSGEAFAGSTWAHVDLSAASITAVQRVASTLMEKGILSTNENRISRLISTLFDGDLPRLPWVVLMFFEIAIEGEDVTHLGLASLVEKYLTLQLTRGRLAGRPVSPAVLREATKDLARMMFEVRSPVLEREEVLTLLGQRYRESALGLSETAVLAQLQDVGILSGDEQAISFSFPVFMDFSYAQVLSQEPLSKDDLDLHRLRRESGALSFLSGIRSSDELCRQAFSLVSSATFDLVRTVKPAELGDIEIPGQKLIESYDSKPITTDELGAIYDQAEARRGRHRNEQLSESPPGTLNGLSLDGFGAALGVLRNGVFLSRDTKRAAVNEAVTLTCTLIQRLLEIKKDIYRALVIGHNYPDTNDDDLIALLMAVIGCGPLTGFGEGEHLSQTICDEIEHETDDFRLVVLLVWLSASGGKTETAHFEKAFARIRSKQALAVLHFWFFALYANKTALEGRKDSRSRALVEALFRHHIKAAAATLKHHNHIETAVDSSMKKLDELLGDRKVGKKQKSKKK